MAVSKIGQALFLVLLVCISISNASNATIEIPCQDNATFRDTCAQVKGKMAGDGRCYFFGNSSGSWYDGFGICAKMGGQFAQVHTTREYDLVHSMAKSLKNDWTWMALRRSIYDHDGQCTVTRNTTYWYDSDFDKPEANATKVTAGNGPMSLREANISTCNKQSNKKDPLAVCILWKSPAWTWYDHNCGCSYSHHILCQYTSRSQNYSKTANVCIDEPPIEEFKANAPDECATRCSRSIWCRSFNFVKDLTRECNTTCQLFACSIEEECPNCPQTRPNYSTGTVTMCYHWNHVW